MALKPPGIKITENKNTGNTLNPRFNIQYSVQGRNEAALKTLSHHLVSLLKGCGDAFLEVSSGLMMPSQVSREEMVLEFIRSIRTLGLKYRYKKAEGDSSGSILKSLFSRTPKTLHEVLVYIPHDSWKQEDFFALLPVNGVRYYLCRSEADGDQVLDSLHNGQMLEEEKLEFFQHILFDVSQNGQMGLASNHITLSELKAILKL